MSWNEDILEAAYTSPTGKRQTFLYEDVSRETDLKTASFTFPELDGALIQSLGKGGRTFPLTCIFAGKNCCKEANSFEKLLGERGHGILEHPLYGRINVVPTGKIKRTDNLASGANVATVDVTFAETIIDVDFPYSEIALEDSLDNSMDEFEESICAFYADSILTDTIEDKIQLQSVMQTQTNLIYKNVSKSAKSAPQQNAQGGILQQFNAAKKFISSNIESLDKIAVFAIETAQSIVKMISIPARIETSVLDKTLCYKTLIKDIVQSTKQDSISIQTPVNQWAVTALTWGSMVASLCSGLAKSAIARSSGTDSESEFKSRSDVLDASSLITQVFNEYSVYVDSQNEKNIFIDTGFYYEKLLNVVIYSLKLLEETAFDLPVTKIIELNKDRQLFELLTEFYGKDGFARQDEFINDNKLTADEIVLLPMGREVRYYV